MKIDKNQAIIFILLSIVFFYVGMTIVGGVFIGLGSFKLKAYYDSPLRKLVERIRTDAEDYQCQIPRSQTIQEKLIDLYRRFDSSEKQFPELFDQYSKIKESFWQAVSQHTYSRDWDKTLSQVLRNWPTPHLSNEGQLLGALDEMQKAAVDLEKVRQEVYG